MINNPFIEAFRGTNKTVPIWLMRQAGRFLPQYQQIKQQRSLEEMFRVPDLAAKITLLPIAHLGVDAAILFADIMTLPSGMGFTIKFVDGKGPVVENPIVTERDVQHAGDMADVGYVEETIRFVNGALPQNIPLIGFAGGPFTVAHYLIKGTGTSTGLSPAVRFAYEHPKVFHALMKKITHNTVEYLNFQKNAGVKAFQLFDSWAGVLRESDYETLVLPYVQEIFLKVDLPSIYYLKNCHHLLESMVRSGAEFLSVCETVTIGQNSVLNGWSKGVQGNFYNGLFYASDSIIKEEAAKILNAARQHHKKYIFNLNHGVYPDTPVEKVKLLISEVHKFKWS